MQLTTDDAQGATLELVEGAQRYIGRPTCHRTPRGRLGQRCTWTALRTGGQTRKTVIKLINFLAIFEFQTLELSN